MFFIYEYIKIKRKKQSICKFFVKEASDILMNFEMIKNILNIEKDASINEVVNSIIIYLRKSRKDRDYFENESIEKTLARHEKQLQEWSLNIFKMEIPEKNIFREVASGDTIEDRPIMQEILNKIEDDNIKAVLCVEIERLARGNTIDQGVIAQAFKYSNTKIITPTKIYNLDNEDDLAYFEDGLYQSRKYLKYVKRILKNGRIRSVNDGKYIGSSSPYGYNKKKLINEKGFTLVFNEEEKKIVDLIANLFAYGIDINYTVKENDTVSSIAKIFSMQKANLVSCNPKSKFLPNDVIEINSDMGTSGIATYLNYLNINPRKASSWTPNMIRNIFSSPTLYGYVSWGKRENVTIMKNGELCKKRPNNKNCKYVKGKFEAILDLKDKRTQIIINKLKNNAIPRSPSTYDLKNPLAGLIICPICKKNMVRRPYNNRSHVDVLYCKTARCSTVGSSLKLVEERLLKSLNEVLIKYTNYIENYDVEYKKEINNSNNLNLVIDTELKKVRAKLDKCYDLLEDGTYSTEIFNKRINKLNLEIETLEKRRQENLQIDLIKKYEIRKNTIPLLKSAIENYEKCATIKQKNDLLSSIIDYVIYEKSKGGRGYEDKFNLKIKLKI